MNESIKAVLALTLIVAGVLAAVGWAVDPSPAVWAMRIACPAVTLAALATFLYLHFRADLAVDYLRRQFGTYFNRDGFCFNFTMSNRDGVAILDAFFQNQRDQPCLGRIALRPAQGFFLTRAKISTIVFEVECPPAAYGMARLPLALQPKLQGKRQSFEVGAAVEYPNGKGRLLRFHDGMFLRANTDFKDSVGTALATAGLFGGVIVLSRPATARFTLPTDVASEVPEGLKPTVAVLWKLGDEPLAFAQ